ncbi:MAG: uncharacterized protein KVP18_001991 [Porospora cf. gigantea A]|uniref:uncharacterized protein n=1 Tax=Porospora cf. gigantea A TaxID=2853593 RepID=UPI00355ACBE0|nr:MAG: hypothetical protein KVP18_001991 [Porospora cf. gigantea A]
MSRQFFKHPPSFEETLSPRGRQVRLLLQQLVLTGGSLEDREEHKSRTPASPAIPPTKSQGREVSVPPSPTFLAMFSEPASVSRPASSVSRPAKRRRTTPGVEAVWSRLRSSENAISVEGQTVALAWLFTDLSTSLRPSKTKITAESTLTDRFPEIFGIVVFVVDKAECHFVRTDTTKPLFDVLEMRPRRVVVPNLKEFLVPVLRSQPDFSPSRVVKLAPCPILDPFLLSWLLRPEFVDVKRHTLDFLAEAWKLPQRSRTAEEPWLSAHEDSVLGANLCRALNARMRTNRDLQDVYSNVELPLCMVLARMEAIGVPFDNQINFRFRQALEERMNTLSCAVREATGIRNVNLASPQQVAHLIYDVLNLQPKKGATNLKTAHRSTAELGHYHHPVVDLIVDYRQCAKILSGYLNSVVPLASDAKPRIYPSWNQTSVLTGRLSCSNPNMQTLPKAVALSVGTVSIRQAVVASFEEWCVVAADYCQVEVRILAHFCPPGPLRQAVETSDLYTTMASRAFRCSSEDVSAQMRARTKVTCLALLYGAGSQTLREQLGGSLDEARAFKSEILRSFPEIALFTSDTVTAARKAGFIRTLLGRTRTLEGLQSLRVVERAEAERQAVNSKLQGSAADLMKVAMLRVEGCLQRLGGRMVLSVHDEIVVECPTERREEVCTALVAEMQAAGKAVGLQVPLAVTVSWGDS